MACTAKMRQPHDEPPDAQNSINPRVRQRFRLSMPSCGAPSFNFSDNHISLKNLLPLRDLAVSSYLLPYASFSYLVSSDPSLHS
ncbi:histidine kinase [Sesbania bispinosa]|nr:histidine kinase [Sesbania bispinosa]